MKFKESFSLIVDNHKPDDYTESIAFMKSFGLKCDCVGWTTIQLDAEDKFELIKKMKEKAKEKGLKLRCQNYKKELLGDDAEWYFFAPKVKITDDAWDWDDGVDFYTTTIKGYKIPKGCHIIEMPYYTAVSQAFVDTCKTLHLTGVDFTWVTDTGRYDATPFFYILPENRFEAATRGYGACYDKTKKSNQDFIQHCRQVDADGSHMEMLATLFNEFEMAQLPILLDPESAPDTDFAYFNKEILVRKTAVERLVEKGVLKWVDLKPAGYLDKNKHNKLIFNCSKDELIPNHIRLIHDENYKKWSAKSRPTFAPKEKDALSLMRKAKKENPEYYNKALKKTVLETLPETSLAFMAPYYKISNGAMISDEIEIFPYEDAVKENVEFWQELQEDEVVFNDMPEFKDAVVFGRAVNGDKMLLNQDGSVLRYDHEEPSASEKWENLHTFLYEEI